MLQGETIGMKLAKNTAARAWQRLRTCGQKALWNTGRSEVYQQRCESEVFDNNRKNNEFHDMDLDNPDLLKVVYTGSFRFANQGHELVRVVKISGDKHQDNMKILIWELVTKEMVLKS